MFDNILLPIDMEHTASWEKSLPIAVKLCGAGGTLHVLGIVHDLGSAIIASYLPEGFEENALRAMKSKLDAFIEKEVPSGTNAVSHVGHGHVPERILAAANEVDADIIVVASHPPGDLMTLLVGSNADKLARYSERPVLVIR